MIVPDPCSSSNHSSTPGPLKVLDLRSQVRHCATWSDLLIDDIISRPTCRLQQKVGEEKKLHLILN